VSAEEWGTDQIPVIAETRSRIIPSLFLFKHGLELALKGFQSELAQDEHLSIKTHNTLEIYRRVKQQYIKLLKVKIKIVKKYSGLSEDEIYQSLNYLLDLGHITEKYISFSGFASKTSKLASISIEDQNNELFRYPLAENIKAKISPQDLISIEIEQVQEILQDQKRSKEIVLNMIKIINSGIFYKETIERFLQKHDMSREDDTNYLNKIGEKPTKDADGGNEF